MLKKIYTTICSIWASFAFMFWVVVAYFAYLLVSLVFGSKKDKEFLAFLYGFIGKLICGSMFLRVERVVHGSYKRNESYVVVSNHQTMIDIPANVVGAPEDILFKFLGKKEAAKLPFFGFLINRLCILVDRKSEESRRNSYQRMKEEMANGFSIFVYPEGTRNRTSEPVKAFYNGAFKLAIEMQKPLVVNTLVGIRELNPPDNFFSYRPGKVYAHWEEPISTLGMTLNDLDKLKAQAADLMKKRLSPKD